MRGALQSPSPNPRTPLPTPSLLGTGSLSRCCHNLCLYCGSLVKMPIFVKIGSRNQSQMEIGYELFPHAPRKAQTSFGRKGCEVGSQRQGRDAPGSPLRSSACSGGGVWVTGTQGTVGRYLGMQGRPVDNGVGPEVAHIAHTAAWAQQPLTAPDL